MPAELTGHVHGLVEPGFEAVADAFSITNSATAAGGAAVAVYADGQKVVDLWTGRAGERPWQPGMRSVVFSVSKGITALCLSMAADAGQLDLDATVASYWPEFAAAGKERLTVRDVLAHRSGLLAPEVPLTASDVRAWNPVVKALAEQTPLWPPGEAFAYHPLTSGWLLGEILHRATGLRPSGWLRDRIALPLQLSMTFGAALDAPDVAPIEPSPPAVDEPWMDASAAELVRRAFTMHGAFRSPDIFDVGNSPEFLECEAPAGNLVASASDLARLYGAVAATVDGTRLLSDAALEDALVPHSTRTPLIGPDDGQRWAAGFVLPSSLCPMAGEGSFGHSGAGGQLAFGNRGLGVSLAYQTTRPLVVADERSNAVSAALVRCL